MLKLFLWVVFQLHNLIPKHFCLIFLSVMYTVGVAANTLEDVTEQPDCRGIDQ